MYCFVTPSVLHSSLLHHGLYLWGVISQFPYWPQGDTIKLVYKLGEFVEPFPVDLTVAACVIVKQHIVVSVFCALCSYRSFREWQTLWNVGSSSKSCHWCFTCYTVVKELHGTTMLVLQFLHKSVGITPAEAFAVLKLPFREETMSRTQVACIRSSRVEWYLPWMVNVWTLSV